MTHLSCPSYLVASLLLLLAAPGCKSPEAPPADAGVDAAAPSNTDASVPATATCAAESAVAAPDTLTWPYPSPLFLRGGLNGWGTPDRQRFVQVGPTALSLATPLPAGTQEFKLGDPGWAKETNFGAAADDATLTPGQQKPLVAVGANLKLTIPAAGIYCFDVTVDAPARPLLTVRYLRPYTDGIDLLQARARWLKDDTLAVKDVAQSLSYTLYHDPQSKITVTTDQISGGEAVPLKTVGTLSKADPWVAKDYPYLDGYTRLTPAQPISDIPALLREQLVLAARDPDGHLRAATSIQTAGVIDQLLRYDGDDLGPRISSGVPTLKLWAPTARSVGLVLYDSPTGAESSRAQLSRGEHGVWSATLPTSARGKYYLYEVEVISRDRGLHKNLTTDPYAVGLSGDSRRSQIVDLSDPALMPAGWDTLAKPALLAFEDISLYELHLREFSINDTSVPAERRGQYLALVDPRTAGMQHLGKLADAGLTHVHLQPLNDFTSVLEARDQQKAPIIPTAAADSPLQQAAVTAVADKDGYSWGYDPFHYGVPEGSYASDPDGTARIVEFRRMVAGLAAIKLRLVMDVVYNHTTAAGQDDRRSVLDRVVPDYYYRLDKDGFVQHASCCADTASEHAMMEKLMIDTLVRWARDYKVDGFRIDYMGFHTISNLQRVRAALDALTPAKDGVDGKLIYLYGEAWRAGTLVDILPDQALHQANIFGTGIGSFNDRLRDAARGGGPFSGVSDQGFATGLFHDYNQDPANTETSADLNQQKQSLLRYMDVIRVGLAGNLRDYSFQLADGSTTTGGALMFRGGAVGYAADPQEIITYVSAHDNNTLWDYVQAKAPFRTPGRTPDTATAAERVRMMNLLVGLVGLSQGVPFFYAGDELLRSKSGDADSYNAGDWFNRLDFTYASNNWGVGLPPALRNAGRWDFWGKRLVAPELSVTKTDIQAGFGHMQEILQIRKSSPLFRLRSQSDIQARVKFLDGGQVPGLIAMSLSDQVAGAADLDPARKGLVVLWNASPKEQEITSAELSGLVLHPVQQASADAVVRAASCTATGGKLKVPGRTTLVCERR